jgi:UDP-glucose 4-epimerase
VTGGAGFIGSSIAAALLERGASVTVLDDFSSGSEQNLAVARGDLDVIRADVSDSHAVGRGCQGVDAIFHQAAVPSVHASVEDPLRCDQVNVHGTLCLLETARRLGVPRVVFAASAAAYGDSEALPKQESMAPEPLSPYAASKVAGEHYMRVYAHLHGMKTLSLRYFNIFGPRQDPRSDYAAAIPKFLRKLLDGEPPVVFGDGQQTRDFCFIDHVVDATLRALELERAEGQVVNVASGSGTSILDLIAMLQRIIGTDRAPRHEETRPGDVRHSRADISRARELLGYEPQVSVEQGLQRTLEWMRGD